MIRPTKRAAALLAIGFPICLVLGIANAGLWPLGAGYLLAALAIIAADALMCLRTDELRVTADPARVIYIGETTDLIVHLASPRARPGVVLEPRCDIDPIIVPMMPERVIYQPGTTANFVLPLRPRQRGIGRLHALWLRWAGPLGLTVRLMRVEIGRDIRITPNIRAVRQGAINLSTRDAFFGAKAVDQSGDGSEFDALRDYTSGLDRRTIEWKHSARSHKLVSKEFRVERNHQIILAFDTGYLMREPLAGMARLDHAINAGLLLTYMALKSGDRVGMFAFAGKPYLFTAPGGSMNAFSRMQRLSSDLAYSAEESNFTLGLTDLAVRLNRRSLIVLMTDFVDTITAELMIENVARLATRHVVLFLCLRDPQLAATFDQEVGDVHRMARATVAYDILRDRQILFERLRRMGVHCLEAEHHQIGPDLINGYLHIKRRELI
nr:DUF58 domain-containing protein [uncultured Dongia sp.]